MYPAVPITVAPNVPSIPVGRQMNVLVWSLDDNSYFSEPVYLDAAVNGAGSEEIVEIDL